jgi:acetamidase/formamidase
VASRRRFLAQAPLAAAGAALACSDRAPYEGARAAAASASPAGAPGAAVAATGTSAAARPAPLLAAVPAGAPRLEYVPKHDELCYTFGGVAPRHVIKPGTHVITWTEDCFDGAVKTAADLPSKVLTPGHDNPQTGPFAIEGAEPGDTIAVHLLRVEPARDYAVSSFAPGFGALVGTDRTAMLGPEFPETTWRYDVDRAAGVARARSRDGRHQWAVPLAPFLGCVGVAPAMGEVRSTIVPSFFGGNMDCPEVRAGNTVFLGVNVPGAMLSIGDGHYAMGDGEIMGAAIEGAMHVEFLVELIKREATPVPRIENQAQVMFVGNGRPLEDAARVAYKAMVRWVAARTGMSELDAWQFTAQNVTAPMVQLVDPEFTVVVKLDKARLPRA